MKLHQLILEAAQDREAVELKSVRSNLEDEKKPFNVGEIYFVNSADGKYYMSSGLSGKTWWPATLEKITRAPLNKIKSQEYPDWDPVTTKITVKWLAGPNSGKTREFNVSHIRGDAPSEFIETASRIEHIGPWALGLIKKKSAKLAKQLSKQLSK